MFKNSSIKTKIILIVSVAILLSSVLTAALSIYSIKQASVDRIEKYKVEAYKDVRENLEKFSSVAISIVKYHYKQSDKEHMKAKALKAIKEMRYGKNGYFWINDMTNRMLMHPIKPEFDGKIFIDAPKVPFVELGVRKLQESKKDSDFIEYSFYAPATKQYSHKLSIVSHFEPWGWVIGTGTYTDYIEKNIQSLKKEAKQQVRTVRRNIILLTLAVFILLTLLASYLAQKAIVKPLQDFRSSLESFFQYLVDPTKKVKPIKINSSDEFAEMSLAVNKSVEASIDKHREISNMIKIMDQTVILTQTDTNGIITDASKAFCDLSGFTKEELIGQPHYVVRHPDMPREIFSDMWEVIQDKKTWTGDIKNVKKDGSFYWSKTIISPKLTKDGEIYGYIAVRCDISDRKELRVK